MGFIRRATPASDASCRTPVRLAQGAKMTDAVTRETRLSGFSLVVSAWHDPAARILNVDLLTVLIALLLPWSTTGVVIAAALWVVALVPTVEPGKFLQSLKRPVSLLPIAMFVLALVGTLWSELRSPRCSPRWPQGSCST